MHWGRSMRRIWQKKWNATPTKSRLYNIRNTWRSLWSKRCVKMLRACPSLVEILVCWFLIRLKIPLSSTKLTSVKKKRCGRPEMMRWKPEKTPGLYWYVLLFVEVISNHFHFINMTFVFLFQEVLDASRGRRPTATDSVQEGVFGEGTQRRPAVCQEVPGRGLWGYSTVRFKCF